MRAPNTMIKMRLRNGFRFGNHLVLIVCFTSSEKLAFLEEKKAPFTTHLPYCYSGAGTVGQEIDSAMIGKQRHARFRIEYLMRSCLIDFKVHSWLYRDFERLLGLFCLVC